MGPTNVALVHLYKADRRLRDARERLDAAARGVRIQERRAHDLEEKLRLAQQSLKERLARQAALELDIKTRDAHIERYRLQQQTAKNNKEYQAFLVEINTAKVDRGKAEDETIKVIEEVEKFKAETDGLASQHDAEKAKLETMKGEIHDTLARLQQEVDELVPDRDAAAEKAPPRAREAFERLAEHHEGEALAALGKPDRRREEYLCMACNMELARDVYNKLHTRDEMVVCPSCRRILYIPEDLSNEAALSTSRGSTKAPAVKRPRTSTRKTTAAARGSTPSADVEDEVVPVVIEKRAKGPLGDALAKAQGESVGRAVASQTTPVECEVYFRGELAGIYKGISVDHLERAVKFFLDESRLPGEVKVSLVKEPESPATPEDKPSSELSAELLPTEPLELADPAPPASASTAAAEIEPEPNDTDVAEPAGSPETSTR